MSQFSTRILVAHLLIWFGCSALVPGQEMPNQSKSKKPAAKRPSYDKSVPKPTEAEVSYGQHERQVLDFWQANAERPTPLVIVIHGGGWKGGSKERLHRFVDPNRLLNHGISVAAINYRLLQHAKEVSPPVKASMNDAARALQFLRSKAKTWNIDKTRIAACGGSAGACTSLWLAFHDDLADPQNDDPILRESTRLFGAAVKGAQTSLDPVQVKQWIPNCTYGGHAFGIKSYRQFAAQRDRILPWIKEYSPIEHVDKGDPAVFLFYGGPPELGKRQKDPVHSSNFGAKLQEACKVAGVSCEVSFPKSNTTYKNTTDCLLGMLVQSDTETPEKGK